MANFTKLAIKATFIELLCEKPLSRITVKDIVEKCGINRNSFYYHFQDIPALIEEIVIEEADRIISEYPTIDSIETGLRAAVDFAEKYKRAILHIYNSVNRDIFEQYLWKVCKYVIDTYARTVFPDEEISEKDKTLIMQLYECQFFGIIMAWMKNGMKDDMPDKITRICELNHGSVEELIRRSKEVK